MVRLSKRAQSVVPSATLALAARARELSRAGKPVLSLAAGEPDFGTPEGASAAGIRAIQAGFTKYTDSAGMPELRRAIAEKLARENGAAYEPSEVVVSSGAKHALFNLLLALVSEGDEVLVPSPYWVSYPDMVALAGGRATPVPCRPEDFHLDLDWLARQATDRTRVLLLNSPNNPTGAVYTEAELREALRLCRDRGIFVVSDEIYEKLVYPEAAGRPRRFASVAAFREFSDMTAVVNGCSKAFAMTGWRIGYAAGPRALMKAVADIQSQSTSHPASISQAAALAALTEPDAAWEQRMFAAFDERRRLFVSGLRKISGIRCVEPEGAFYVFPKVDAWFGRPAGRDGVAIRDAEDFARVALEEAHVAFVPGGPFGDARHVRFSYAASLETLEEALARLLKLFV